MIVTGHSRPARCRLPLAAVAVALSVPIAGCEDKYDGLPQIQPTQVVVRTSPPTSGPRPDARNPTAPVTVRNGAGEVLLDGVPNAQGRIAARHDLPLSMLDGTLVIEQRLNSGDISRETFTAPPGRPATIRQDPATGRFTVVTTEPARVAPQALLDFNYGWVNRPNESLLPRESGGSLRGFALNEDNNSSGFGFLAGLSIPLAPDLPLAFGRPTTTRVDLYASYDYADAENSQDVIAANGQSTRIFRPAGSGIVTPLGQNNVKYSNEFEEYGIGARLRSTYRLPSARVSYVQTLFGAELGKQRVDDRLDYGLIGTSAVVNQRQKTDSTFVGIPFGGGWYLSLDDFESLLDETEGLSPEARDRVTGLFLYVYGEFEPRYNSGDTNWTFQATGLPSSSATLSADKFTFGAKLGAGMMFGDPLGRAGGWGTPITASLGFEFGTKAFPQVEYTNLSAGNGGAELDYKNGTYTLVRLGGRISLPILAPPPP